MATVHPSAARTSAPPRPMPLPPQVTQAIRFPFDVINTSTASRFKWLHSSTFATAQSHRMSFIGRPRSRSRLVHSERQTAVRCATKNPPHVSHQLWTVSSHFVMFFTVSP
jgi:hypothetical protein